MIVFCCIIYNRFYFIMGNSKIVFIRRNIDILLKYFRIKVLSDKNRRLQRIYTDADYRHMSSSLLMFLLMMAKAVCSTVLTLFLPALRGPITASSVSEKEDLSRCRL